MNQIDKYDKNSKTVTLLAKQKLDQHEGYDISRKKILAYIDSIVGENYFTDGMIARGIANITNDKNYIKTGHGCYRKLNKIEKEHSFRLEANIILKDTCIKLRNVISKSDDYIKENIDKASSSLNELEELVKTTKYINNIINLIENNINE